MDSYLYYLLISKLNGLHSSTEAAELALKALLIQRNLFTENVQTHNLREQFDRLRQHGTLQSPETVEELVDQIEPVQAYQETSNTYVNVCDVAQVGNLRYPLEEGLEITCTIAEQKCDAARRLLDLVREELAE